MVKWDCDVVRDLMPSYLDEICSDASRKIVEEHLQDCDACRNLMEQMQATEFGSEQAQQMEIDYMKKVRRRFGNGSRILVLMLGIVLVAGFGILLWRYGDVPMELYYVVQPVLTVSVYLAFSGEWKKAERTRWKWGFGVVGLAAACYGILLMFAAMAWAQAGVLPFGMQPAEWGPFVYRQLLAGAFVQASLLLLAVHISTKSGNACPLLLDLHITGGCIALVINSLLRRMSTLEGFREQLIWGIVILSAEGCAILLVLLFMERRRRQEAV